MAYTQHYIKPVFAGLFSLVFKVGSSSMLTVIMVYICISFLFQLACSMQSKRKKKKRKKQSNKNSQEIFEENHMEVAIFNTKYLRY